ncbi:hypothetical protein PO124_32745 [Bacillus licheniformis]|nr:hypothetical protein [Bacillus licheniformis]
MNLAMLRDVTERKSLKSGSASLIPSMSSENSQPELLMKSATR